MPLSDSLFKQIKQLIPPLNGTLHKGQSGRVGVLGGALDYTGAPYFAAISSQRLGADLSHVICSPTAAGAIKGYAPDLIVHPILREDKPRDSVKSELDSLLRRLHVLIVGPGLGREDYMQEYARIAVRLAREQKMYLVLDADALFLVGNDPKVISGYEKAVLTPNVVEFKRLSEAVNIDPSTEPSKRAQLVSQQLGGVTIIQKGPEDLIAVHPSSPGAEPQTTTVDVPGGLKRCGGQGDILSGAAGTFLAWGKCFEDGAWGPTPDDAGIPVAHIPFLGATGASIVTRTISKRGFKKKGRSLITADLIDEIGDAFIEVFGEEAGKGKL
ncbi:Ribokinase-like protein [Fomitiporia mediterranea MF3/22]|uniref:Ribokinase-like protein n=1 Tax=Fomitiporia mediterranea (strain MF3/22) TaxID=694068 RepID=UPI0004408345|nr:Ribokinase-like protein [Fomitiporia mediterranea MF3/22]EJC99974.1 Ribokinase-like protein [Fomitiporia mediterranea MF3/22]